MNRSAKKDTNSFQYKNINKHYLNFPTRSKNDTLKFYYFKSIVERV